MVSFTPRPLYTWGNRSRCPLSRKLGGPQSRSGRGGEEKNSHHCTRREMNPGREAGSLIAILTELSRFLIVMKFVTNSKISFSIQTA
jgi:hypothetical protein